MHDDFAPPPVSGSWDSALLAPVAEINEQMLACLRQLALQDAPEAPPLVALLRDQWRRMDASAQRRVAACPYLLLDAGFTQPQRWERVACPGVSDAAPRRGYFTGGDGIALLRRTLVFAWHLARSNRLTGRLILGMNSLSAERIAAARLADLEALAELGPAWIVPRWEAQPAVWRQLISAGCRGAPLLLRQAQLRGLQLLARAGEPRIGADG
jgi:hypothetical protein